MSERAFSETVRAWRGLKVEVRKYFAWKLIEWGFRLDDEAALEIVQMVIRHTINPATTTPGSRRDG